MNSNVQDNISAFQRELSDLIAKVTQKRTELATVSKQTIEHLNTEIPRLRAEAESKAAEIARLDKVIADKAKKASEQKESLEAEYKALELNIITKYQAKYKIIEAREAEIKEIKASYDDKLASLVNRELALQSATTAFSANKESFEKDLKAFNKKKEDYLKELARLKDEAEDLVALNKEEKKELEKLSKEIVVRTKSLNMREETVNGGIDKASKILEDARTKESNALSMEEKNKESEAKLNTLAIQIRADQITNSRRTDALNEVEQKLNLRDKNIKLVEASLAQR